MPAYRSIPSFQAQKNIRWQWPMIMDLVLPWMVLLETSPPPSSQCFPIGFKCHFKNKPKMCNCVCLYMLLYMFWVIQKHEFQKFGGWKYLISNNKQSCIKLTLTLKTQLSTCMNTLKMISTPLNVLWNLAFVHLVLVAYSLHYAHFPLIIAS